MATYTEWPEGYDPNEDPDNPWANGGDGYVDPIAGQDPDYQEVSPGLPPDGGLPWEQPTAMDVEPTLAATPTPTTQEAAPSPGGATATYAGDGGVGSYGGTGTGSLLAPYPGTYQQPDLQAKVQEALGMLPNVPQFNAPEIPTINPWEQPSFDSIYQDQSYLGRKKEGEQALLNYKAAKGLARLPSTMKDLLSYNQDFAGREYGNIANRSLEGWRSNTDATLRRSGMEQDRAKSLYEPQFAEYQNKVNTVSRVPREALDQSWREFLTNVDLWRDQRDSTFDKLSWLSNFDRDSAAL